MPAVPPSRRPAVPPPGPPPPCFQAEFKNGLRVTDGPTMDVVEMVLGGRVNKGLVTLIQQAGGQAVGLCGKDASLLAARQLVEKEIGFVGDITSVDARLLATLVASEYIPVVASVAADSDGQALNVNADIAAGEIAAALRAEKLILMTDVPGVLRDKDDVATKAGGAGVGVVLGCAWRARRVRAAFGPAWPHAPGPPSSPRSPSRPSRPPPSVHGAHHRGHPAAGGGGRDCGRHDPQVRRVAGQGRVEG